MIFVAASRLLALRSAIFAVAISLSCVREIDPALILPGSFEPDLSPAAFLIRKLAGGLKSGSKEPGKISGGTITRAQLAEIAQTKMADLSANSIEQATKIIEGSARSMGLTVVEG